MGKKITHNLKYLVFVVFSYASFSALAVPINWTDWTSESAINGYTATGSIISGTETIGVTYTNAQGIGFSQMSGGGIDYWQNNRSGRDPATSPYTSTGINGVDNIPTGTDILALSRQGSQTLNFTQAIANPVFAFVSLNRNGYAFDQDFEILSLGGVDGNDCGYWGCGGAEKVIVDLGGGNFEYQLNANNVGGTEPHGVIRFSGAFDTVTWRSSTNEFWNGFTVGVQGTADQVFPCQQNPNLPQCQNTVPEPGTLGLVIIGIVALSRRLKVMI
ncbi:MAG: PEP-CTERM sorting domain-containing protein [Burkholderiales bacterium]|nr:PEP-CTERM sorting domain-containing protein [Burkholderiales bacterium]MDR4517430.1 PEP-CTERM sorting domain-containing protein [Nitrosomonas sp.]